MAILMIRAMVSTYFLSGEHRPYYRDRVGDFVGLLLVFSSSRSARITAREFFGHVPSRWSRLALSHLNSNRNCTVMPRAPARTFATMPPSSRSVLPSSASDSASSCLIVSFGTADPTAVVLLNYDPTLRHRKYRLSPFLYRSTWTLRLRHVADFKCFNYASDASGIYCVLGDKSMGCPGASLRITPSQSHFSMT